MEHGVPASHGVLLYDGDCAFCTHVALCAKRLRMGADVVSMQSVDLDALGVDALRAQSEVPFLHPNGEVDYGHRAIASALMSTPAPWNTFARVLTFGPVNALSARGYRFVADHRHQLPGGSPRCRIDGSN